MITFIVHLQVPPRNAQAFEDLMTYVSKTTLENEPGVVYYGFAKSVDEADTYSAVEVYRDQAAVAAHGETAWVTESVPKMLQLVEGMPQLKQYVSPGADSVVSRFEEMTQE
jgi:quinol monooxygenase YgiN